MEAKFYKQLKDNKVRCNLCNHRCLILPNKTGLCGVRQNQGGKLYTLVYGRPISVHVDPIEKKPFYRFMAGTATLSFGTFGCNFRCNWCQNWEISQTNKGNPDIIEKLSAKVSPKQMIDEARKQKCPSISYTYTEPTIFFEYALDTMSLAHEAGLKNIWVSNGYFTKKAFRQFEPYLDAINIDLKGFSNKNYIKYCGARLRPVLKNLKRIKEAKHIHLEITTLLIPGVNDNEKELKKLVEFIAKKIGPETPWHISRFFPAYKMTENQVTPTKTMEKAQKLAYKAGLKYVYLGNI
jgi:pyruvate formate lyase activating enzyme